MLNEIFDINKFNIFSDNDNYYFFRALNNADYNDITTNITTNNGKIERIRTDRERYEGTPIYSEESQISLMEIFEHIKMHHDKTTNCVSLTSNANAAIVYGRGNYNDKYVVVKVPKKELGKKVYNAGLYMLEETNKKIDEIIESGKLEDYAIQKYFYDAINNARSQERLDEIKLMLPKEYVDRNDIFVGGLEFNFTDTKQYQALSARQNLEKNKTIMKLDILNKQLLPKVSNRYLIQTVGNAFSSLELIHYKDIEKESIIEVPKEIVDILALIQQLPEDLEYVDEVKQVILSKINRLTIDNEYIYQNFNVDNEKFTLEEMYNLTNGRYNYKIALETYKKAFYLAKSKLRAENSSKILVKILNNEPKYNEIISYIKNKTYGIEPEITTKLSNNLHAISESVSLDFSQSEEELFEYIDKLDIESLVKILNNPNETIKLLLNDFIEYETITVDKEEWYANSIIELLDWESFGVKEKLSQSQREDIINALKEHNFMEIYEELKNKNISQKDISKALFTMLIKEKTVIDFKEEFTLEELEWFIGYNRIKGTNLKLKQYQKPVFKNINKAFSEKQFTSAILPTGTGKSYIAIAQMYEHRDEEILYLAPNVEILNQLKAIIKEVYNPEEHLGENDTDIIKRIFPKLTLATYQDLKDKSNNAIKEKYSNNYGLIIFDELHRTGAKEWNSQVHELLDNQKGKVKVLGITATPERDVDLKDMADHWAQHFGYTDEEILKQKHIAVNMDIIEAIKTGIVANPKVVNCEYSLIEDGSLDNLKLSIENITDENLKREELIKYETLRRKVENSDGIEKILRKNLKIDGKYIVFLPITKKDNGEYEDEDGNKVDKSTAERVIKDYQILMRQYIFSYDYLNKEDNRIREIYTKIVEGKEIDNIDLDYLKNEKENILLLSKIDIKGKPSALNTETNIIADTIIKYMNFERLSVSEQTRGLRLKTEAVSDDYSMLGSYSQEKNNKELRLFNKEPQGKIKLMFVMNKLNEGVHAKGINGIIWLRPLDSNSKILYLQQLGRCISAVKEGTAITEEDRPLVLDLVNNTLKVNLDKGMLQEEIDLLKLNIIESWIHNNGEKLPDLDSKNKTEQEYAKSLIRINKRYSKYSNNTDLLKSENVSTRVMIEEIVKIGSNIGLWQMDIEYIETERKNQNKSIILQEENTIFKISEVSRNFVELQQIVQQYNVYTNDQLTQLYIDYLYIEDERTRKKKGYVNRDDKTPIGNTIMGSYIGIEQRATKKLQEKQEKESLTEEEQQRINNYNRIIETQNKIRQEEYGKVNLTNDELTELYIKYLYLEDETTQKKKGYVKQDDKTPIGNTTMGSYIRIEQQVTKKLQEKQERKSLTEEEQQRINNYNRIKETQNKIREEEYGNNKLTQLYIDYLYVEDEIKGKKKGYVKLDDKTPIGNTTMGSYLGSEQKAVKKLQEKEGLTGEEQQRINNYNRIIDEKNKIIEDEYGKVNLTNDELTELYIKYLYVEDESNGKKKGYVKLDDKTPIGNTIMGSYIRIEQQATKKLHEKERLTREEQQRINNYNRIIEIQNKIREEDNLSNEQLTDLYINYLYIEDERTRKKKGYVKQDDKTLIGNTTMGAYLNREQQATKKLHEKERLTREEQQRINNYNRIIETQNKIRQEEYGKVNLTNDELTELYIKYLYLEDETTQKKKGYVNRDDKTPIGNTTMGSYLHSEQTAVKKLEEKEYLTKEEQCRIDNYNRIIAEQNKIREELKSQYNQSKQKFDKSSVFNETLQNISSKENNNGKKLS